MSDNDLTAAYAALAAFQGEVGAIPKTKTAKVQHKDGRGSHSFTYADLADVLTTALPIASKHGLALHQVTRITGNGGMVITTELVHAGGGRIPGGDMPVGSVNAPMQQIGANLTYARRYAACIVFGLASEEDTDAQFTSGGDPDAWRKNAEPAQGRATNRRYEDRKPQTSNNRPRGPMPPPAEDPLPQERSSPEDPKESSNELTVELTDEQRADEDKYLVDLDIVEDTLEIDAVWRKWKPHFQKTMSEQLVLAMYDHAISAKRRIFAGGRL